MINFEELNIFFNDIIKADSNPYFITTKEVIKEDGEIKTKYIKEEIILEEVDDIFDLILNNDSIEYIDYYPKTFFKKLFNIKEKVNLSLNLDDSKFVLISDKTNKIVNINCNNIITIEDNDKIIIGDRSRLVYYEDNDKLFINIDKSKLKTIIIR
jgi:hypothetical protein